MPVYVLTGANRGLGLEFVRQLSASPSDSIIAGVRSLCGDLKELQALNKHTNVHILECDTSSTPSIASFAEQVTKVLGSKDAKIDYVLNNAGINSVPEISSFEIPPDVFHEHMQINVLGPAKLVEGLESHLQKGSVVMNMTSEIVSIARTSRDNRCPVYCISKAAVNMLTVKQARYLEERGTVVMCMDPGWVKTRMGGEDAILEADYSISSMLKVLQSLNAEDTAKFYTYTGEELPW